MRTVSLLWALLATPLAWGVDRTLDERAAQESARLVPLYEKIHAAPELDRKSVV